nr:hypothetical protein [Variovorax boronicumulans]
MIGIGTVQQTPRVLPSVAPRSSGAPASAATADFATLMRAAGQGSPPVISASSVGQADPLAQASRRPDIEAALAQFDMARRVPSLPASRSGRFPPGTLAGLPEPKDCDAAPVEIASACVQAHEVDRCDARRQDPLVLQDGRCARELVDGVPVPCVQAVAESPVVWPSAWGTWPFYPSAWYFLQTPRLRVWRRRLIDPAGGRPAGEDGGDGGRRHG